VDTLLSTASRYPVLTASDSDNGSNLAALHIDWEERALWSVGRMGRMGRKT